MNTTDTNQNPVDVKQLTDEQRKDLMAQLAAEEKAARDQKKKDKQAFKQLQNEFLDKNIDQLICLQNSLEDHVKNLFKDYQPVLDLKKMIFGENIEAQESHTMTSEDGSRSICIGHNVNIAFDGTESAGIQKIKDFLVTLSSDYENAQKLSKAVNVLLKPNGKTGMLNPARIIQLAQMKDDFKSELFNEGVEIIQSAQHKVKSTMYVSGHKIVDKDGIPKKVTFRFTIE
ncbi:MAG: hypothetical protein JST78_09685 [Bacteroidetes bacterium]|nr:hypothetical protein [Bacteroidota bacterium]